MRYFSFFILLIIWSYGFASDKKDDIFMSSVVKSDEWEIDRKNNIEHFRKNVSFKNSYYYMKSNYAIYNRNTHQWEVDGNVYCKKKFDNGSFLEVYCDRARYFEQTDITNLFSNKRISFFYYDSLKNQYYTSYSKKAIANNNTKDIEFYEDFELNLSSINATSQYAIYRDKEQSFELTMDPLVRGFNEEYRFYLTANKIMVNKQTYNVLAEKKVYGAVKRR